MVKRPVFSGVRMDKFGTVLFVFSEKLKPSSATAMSFGPKNLEFREDFNVLLSSAGFYTRRVRLAFVLIRDKSRKDSGTHS